MKLDFAPDTQALVLLCGLLLSLVCNMTTRISPGGMIVPGWLALSIVEGFQAIYVLTAATAVTVGAVMLLRRVTNLFGKRLFAASVSIGGFVMLTAFITLHTRYPVLFPHDTLGLIVPGLIAYQLVRQPMLPTIAAMAATTAAAAGITVVAVVVAS